MLGNQRLGSCGLCRRGLSRVVTLNYLFDLIVVVVVIISATLAMVRGFAREVLSVASWLTAVGAAYFGYKPLVPMVKAYVESGTIATIISAAVIFFIALVVASFITTRISDFIIDSRVGAVDRGLGFIFGAVRGLLLLVIALLFFSWLAPKPPKWVAEARSEPVLMDLGQRLMAALPQNIESQIMQHIHGGSDADNPGGNTDSAAPPDDTSTSTTPPANPSYGDNSRQNLDQLIQNSGAGN
jgi:membrane protein required for colicin V production